MVPGSVRSVRDLLVFAEFARAKMRDRECSCSCGAPKCWCFPWNVKGFRGLTPVGRTGVATHHEGRGPYFCRAE